MEHSKNVSFVEEQRFFVPAKKYFVYGQKMLVALIFSFDISDKHRGMSER